MEEKILGKSFEEMSTDDMQEIFGGTDENIEPRISPTVVLTAVSGAATSFVGSYLVTAVFCKD